MQGGKKYSGSLLYLKRETHMKGSNHCGVTHKKWRIFELFFLPITHLCFLPFLSSSIEGEGVGEGVCASYSFHPPIFKRCFFRKTNPVFDLFIYTDFFFASWRWSSQIYWHGLWIYFFRLFVLPLKSHDIRCNFAVFS